MGKEEETAEIQTTLTVLILDFKIQKPVANYGFNQWDDHPFQAPLSVSPLYFPSSLFFPLSTFPRYFSSLLSSLYFPSLLYFPLFTPPFLLPIPLYFPLSFLLSPSLLPVPFLLHPLYSPLSTSPPSVLSPLYRPPQTCDTLKLHTPMITTKMSAYRVREEIIIIRAPKRLIDGF